MDVLAKSLKEKDIDVVVLYNYPGVVSDINLEYFTGLSRDSAGILVMDPYQKNHLRKRLFVWGIDYDRVKKQNLDVQLMNVAEWEGDWKYLLRSTLEERAKERGIKKDEFKVGVALSFLSASIYKVISDEGYKTPEIQNILSRITAVKEPNEIEGIKEACKISNYGIKFLKKNLPEKGITEREVALRLERKLKEKGADEVTKIMVASGERSAYPHVDPFFTDEEIKGFGWIDYVTWCYGKDGNKYCSDVTVPFFKGELSKERGMILQTVERAYERAKKEARIGIKNWELHKAIDEFMTNEGKGLEEEIRKHYNLKHGLGHGLGREIHGAPRIFVPKKDEMERWEIELKPNMTFTLEPGIYVPGIGGFRKEDTFLLTEDGLETLTKSEVLRF